MSSTLSWAHSGLGAKTGTTVAALIADIVSLVNSKSGDAAFKWQVASSTTASSPNYVVLKPKAGGAGRILLAVWTSAPAGNNAAILDEAPTTNALYGAWFPAGNVDTPSNLTASSGTILGDDTGCVKVWARMAVATIYGASFQPFYFDSDEAVIFGFQNPEAGACYGAGAGALLVDTADDAYGAVVGFGGGSLAQFGTASATGMPLWATAKPNAGTSTACIRTNYGSADRVYFYAFTPSGAWAARGVDASDVLTDTTNADAYFAPVALLGQTKGEGPVLKLRQIAWGPGTLGAFTVYNETGPVEKARQFNAATTGGNGYPWMVSKKV